ncbi:hypothetical protein E4U55_005839 [Claviceps digitariae]|nr:hypothetical protein E4U55_005839 [Claviceps digitariae]
MRWTAQKTGRSLFRLFRAEDSGARRPGDVRQKTTNYQETTREPTSRTWAWRLEDVAVAVALTTTLDASIFRIWTSVRNEHGCVAGVWQARRRHAADTRPRSLLNGVSIRLIRVCSSDVGFGCEEFCYVKAPREAWTS